MFSCFLNYIISTHSCFFFSAIAANSFSLRFAAFFFDFCFPILLSALDELLE